MGDGASTSGPERPEHDRKHETSSFKPQASSLHMISRPCETHSPRPQRPPYLPGDRGSRKRPRRRRRRGRREYAAADDKAGDDTTDVYVDKDESDNDGGVGGEGSGRGRGASAVPVTRGARLLGGRSESRCASLLGRDHDRVDVALRTRSLPAHHIHILPSPSSHVRARSAECRIRSRR